MPIQRKCFNSLNKMTNAYFEQMARQGLVNSHNFKTLRMITQPAITCSKLTIETLEQGVKYVQS